MTPQTTFRELMDDPIFRQWTTTKPKAPEYANWRVYAQRIEDGPWAKRDFKSWKKALKFQLKGYKRWHDCALISRNWESKPPIVARKEGKRRVRRWYQTLLRVEGHHWCGFCRRPTVFRCFSKHHAFQGRPPLPYVVRCSVCGISQDHIKRY